MGLAVGEAPAHGSADPWCDLRIERVHVEGHVDEAAARDPVERLRDGSLDSDAVDLAHREDADARLSEQAALPVVERPNSEQRNPSGIDRRQWPHAALEPLVRKPERGGKRHSVNVPARARLRRVDVGVGVDPEHPPGAANLRKTPERPERDRVIAAEDERDRAGLDLLDDLRRDALARRLDLRKEAGSLVVDSRRLRDRRLDVPVVANVVAQAQEAFLEPRVADRGRPHVDSAPPLPEVERRADDRDLTSDAVAHGIEPTARRGCLHWRGART